jgi:hypothetical protein
MRAQMKEVRGTRAQAERYVMFPVRQTLMFTGNPEMLLLPRCWMAGSNIPAVKQAMDIER